MKPGIIIDLWIVSTVAESTELQLQWSRLALLAALLSVESMWVTSFAFNLTPRCL